MDSPDPTEVAHKRRHLLKSNKVNIRQNNGTHRLKESWHDPEGKKNVDLLSLCLMVFSALQFTGKYKVFNSHAHSLIFLPFC